MRLRPSVIVAPAVLLAVQAQEHLAPAGRDNALVVVFSAPLRFMRAAGLPPDGLRRNEVI